MCQTKVINIKNAPKDWRDNPEYVYIGRRNHYHNLLCSKWSNPFKILPDRDRDECICLYREYLLEKYSLFSQIEELRGKILVCWCKPLSCHGDVIVKLLSKKEPIVQKGFNF